MDIHTLKTDDVFDVPGQTLVLAMNLFDSFPDLDEMDRQNILGCLLLAFGFYTHRIHEHAEDILYGLIAAQNRIKSQCEKELLN